MERKKNTEFEVFFVQSNSVATMNELRTLENIIQMLFSLLVLLYTRCGRIEIPAQQNSLYC